MDSQQDFAPAFAILTNDERRSAGPEPAPEELLAYLDGDLSCADEEHLRERLSLHPQATQLLLDLADPCRLGDAEHAPAPGWDELRKTLHADGLLAPPAPVVRRRSWRRGGVHPAWRWAAAALFVLSAGLALRLVRLDAPVPASKPATDVVHHVLEPVEVGTSRDAEPGEELAAGEAAWQTLVLLLGDAGDFPEHRLEILAEDSGTVWSGAGRPTPTGTFDVLLPSSFLAAGGYEIRLVGIDGDRRETLATYRFVWGGSAGTHE